MNKKYKFLGETSFKCFVEHYKELEDYLRNRISNEIKYHDFYDINIDNINFQDSFLGVKYHIFMGQRAYYLEVSYDELDNISNK